MIEGCKLIDNNKCIKYGCKCYGTTVEKRDCPLWGETIASEEFYEIRRKYRW
jgi:hypothetical protein